MLVPFLKLNLLVMPPMGIDVMQVGVCRGRGAVLVFMVRRMLALYIQYICNS